MATDAQGNIYVGGNASWLPTVSAFQLGALGYTDPFVIKFDPTGSTMLYATFVGGSAPSNTPDTLGGMAVDTAGHAIATGGAWSRDFPIVNGVRSSNCPFLFALNPAGNGLVYSTCLAIAGGNAVATDSSGNAYSAGYGGVEKYALNGSSVPYTATLTGATAITVDSQGFAYVAGSAAWGALPTGPGVKDVTGGQCAPSGEWCTFVAKVSVDGTTILWQAILGGSGTQTPHAIVRDPNSGVIYVAGETNAPDLPVTAGAIQPALHGQVDGFIASLAPDGSAFGFVTYLGGSQDDEIYALALTSGGQIVVAGDTLSQDFPVGAAIQPAIGGNNASLFVTNDSGNSWTQPAPAFPAAAILTSAALATAPPSLILAPLN
jgi:hypothetical protein